MIDEIRSKPADQRAWIGATFDSIDSAAAAVQLGLPPDMRGAAVIAVFAGSPASKAGLREGDVVVSIDGRPVRSSEDVVEGAARARPGRLGRARRRRRRSAACHGDGRQAAGDAAGRLKRAGPSDQAAVTPASSTSAI